MNYYWVFIQIIKGLERETNYSFWLYPDGGTLLLLSKKRWHSVMELMERLGVVHSGALHDTNTQKW